MLTGLLVKFKHSCPALWRMVESVNSLLTGLRYGSVRAHAADQAARMDAERADGLRRTPVTAADAEALSRFLNGLGEERARHFDPHPFDPATLRRMAGSRAFVMWKVTDSRGEIVGYNFLRCFCNGVAFHGLAVGARAAGRGLGTSMWTLGARTAAAAGMKMRATISEANIPSLRSCRRGTDCRIAGHLDGGYLLVECTPRQE